MKVDEAISLLAAIRDDRKAKFNLDDDHPGQQAIQLGIEALKHYQEQRKRRGATQTMWLLGETKE